MQHRIEIALKKDQMDPEGFKLQHNLFKSGWKNISSVRTIHIYSIKHPGIGPNEHLEQLADDLFVDPVLNIRGADRFLAEELDYDWYVEVGFRAGVTDNPGKVAQENLSLRLGPFNDSERVASSIGYLIQGEATEEEITEIARDWMMNPLIQRMTVIHKDQWDEKKEQLLEMPDPTAHESVEILTLDCSTADKILDLSQKRVLALSREEADVIAAWFAKEEVQKEREEVGLPDQPTDFELEVLAQTWSEHCKHKIFNATIQYTDEEGNTEEINSLYKTHIQGGTKKIRADLGEDDWCLSVFKDNAGVIKFNDDWSMVMKVETHNSPSALDPYGGALTGIVGVNRDPFGTGMGSKLLFNTDVFCFGPPEYNKPLPKRLLHPTRIFEGVRLGVEHGGNHSGVPTVNGAILFDDCFVGKPLVFCGTGSIMPAKHQGRPAHDKDAEPGDLIVMCGGRIGMDGIHGATFSSVALDENSPVSAVQIGDPITQKRMFDFLWEARERGLYHCITDNGAGGLSSSVGEMAEFTGGFKIHMDKAPLKYQGLHPWEIFISEAQERMTLAVPEENIKAFMELSQELQVESTVLGEFTDSGYGEAFYKDKLIAKLDMEFLHKGLPAMRLKAVWKQPELSEPDFNQPEDMGKMLHNILGALNVCSKESVIRQYDHEVQGTSVIKPLVGKEQDGPGDAAVIRPVLDSNEGIAVGNGINPRYSLIDTYHMMACVVDEGIRNIIAIGGSLEQMAGLDNFCWPDPVQSDYTPDGEYKLAQLVRANKALYDYTTGFGVPCISGKDSMKNDANLEGQKISILPTVLFSTIGKIKDVRKCITMDVKNSGDLVYLIGDTRDECGGSEYYHYLGYTGKNVPTVNLNAAKDRFNMVSAAVEDGLIASCHDCSDGGFAVAAAEKAFAGHYGMKLDISKVIETTGIRMDKFLFSETPSRFVATVKPENQQEFEKVMSETDLFLIGKVTDTSTLEIASNGQTIVNEALNGLKGSWKKTLN